MRLGAVFGLMSLAGLLSACSERAPTAGPDDGLRVNVEDNRFSPTELTVALASTVRWEWRGGNIHNVTFDDGPASRTQSQGSYTRAFGAAGSYPYHCTIHGLVMAGTVQVTAP